MCTFQRKFLLCVLVQIGFGVLLWELFTHGLEPYPGIKYQMRDLLSVGYRMESPDDCPTRVYDLMRHCWENESDNRPTFSEVLVTLNSMSDFNEGKLLMCSMCCYNYPVHAMG